jgi:ComF family protein
MRLPVVPQTGCCRRCSRPVAGLEGAYVCETCAAQPPAFDRAAAALRFEGDARRALLDFKFNRHFWLRDDFADWLEAVVRVRVDPSAVDLVLPVPSTCLHRWVRGYDPCAILAAALARRLDRRMTARAMARTGRPRRQSELPAAARGENVKGTFVVRRAPLVRGRTVLVVDDVVTTGATLSECARTLKAAGAARVWCVALARTPDQ